MRIVFQCEDDLDGILTAVYEAFYSRLGHSNIELEVKGEHNLQLFCEYREIETDGEKTQKVLKTVRERMGIEVAHHICKAAACEDGRKADAIYRMIVLGLRLKNGKQVVNCLADVNVDLVMKFSQKVWNEAHRMEGFVRFKELEQGILFSKIEPMHDILPLIAPHFVDRFRYENWMIYDSKREQVAVHSSGKGWIVVDAAEMDQKFLEKTSKSQDDFEKMWKVFFKSVTIVERKNEKLQKQLLPLKFRAYMPEFESV